MATVLPFYFKNQQLLVYSSPYNLFAVAIIIVGSVCSVGGVVVTFAAARMPRSEVQTSTGAEIWIEISDPCTHLLRLWDHNIRYLSSKPENSPKKGLTERVQMCWS